MTFETTNQQLAAFCVYAGLVLLEVRRDGKSLIFSLDDPTDEGPELQREFRAATVTNARALLEAYDEVRREIREYHQRS